MSLSKTLIKNSLSNYTGFTVTAIIGLFISPVVIHHLGNIGFGIWALFQSFFGYFGLLDLGLGISVIKFISEFKAKGEHGNVNIFGSTLFFTYIVLGLIGMLVRSVLRLLLQRFLLFLWVFDELHSMVCSSAV